ncbi:AsnC family transcriptional regulator [Psychromonas sp. PT13]
MHTIDTMDNTDRQLLTLFRKNARMPVVNLAKELKVSSATVQN